jgi:hypothetical protein
LPCRGSLDLQKTLHIRIKEEKIIIITLHINDKVQAESQVISDSQEKKNVQWLGLPGKAPTLDR